jgi:hypothetical protein
MRKELIEKAKLPKNSNLAANGATEQRYCSSKTL